MSQSFYANTPEGYRTLAIKYAETGDVDKAIQLLNNTIEAYGSDETNAILITTALGEIYRDYSKDYTMALRTFERAYLDYPGTTEAPNAMFQAAKISEDSFRDFSKARQTYKKIMDIYPTAPIRDQAYLEYHRLLQMGY
ncbi:tetratricopeptide repeat protein [bacterium]|nr:tetratricopeptide repeat protein [bacterium]